VATSNSNLAASPTLRVENVGPHNDRPFWSIDTSVSEEGACSASETSFSPLVG
jgi:hypothetical protein